MHYLAHGFACQEYNAAADAAAVAAAAAACGAEKLLFVTDEEAVRCHRRWWYGRLSRARRRFSYARRGERSGKLTRKIDFRRHAEKRWIIMIMRACCLPSTRSVPSHLLSPLQTPPAVHRSSPPHGLHLLVGLPSHPPTSCLSVLSACRSVLRGHASLVVGWKSVQNKAVGRQLETS